MSSVTFNTIPGCLCARCVKEREQKAEVAQGARIDPAKWHHKTPKLGDILDKVIAEAKAKYEPPVIKLRSEPAPKRDYKYEAREFHENPEAVLGEFISSGCYGKVYNHKSEQSLVVKTFDVVDGYSVWMAYAALAYRQGMGNSVLPRIYAVSLPDRVDSQMEGYVLMERLDARMSDVDLDTDKYRAFEYVRQTFTRYTSEVLEVGQSENKLVNSGFADFGKVSRVYTLGTKHMQRVGAISRSSGFGLNTDMHSGNFMLRGEDIVITDPFTLEWVGSDMAKTRNAAVHASVTRMCKEAAAFTPGFYSEYSMRREINIV